MPQPIQQKYQPLNRFVAFLGHLWYNIGKSADILSAVFLSRLLGWGFFVITKGGFMQKVSYMGDGSTTEFYFNFPFFENSNVIVTANNTAATGYSIVGTSGGMDADIPYIGGKVVFEIAPTSIDCITIARQLPLERIVYYQPLSKIDPTTLNQDLNYLMEVIKDRKDELADLTTKYTEIADKESTDIILARISAIHEEIVDIDAKIRALGDISQIHSKIATLSTNKLDKTLDNIPDATKQLIADICMPDYINQIRADNITSGTKITCPQNSQVIVWGKDQYMEGYYAYVYSPTDEGPFVVGYRGDDTNGNTEWTSFSFLVPAGWKFTCTAENGFSYCIYPLKGL